MPRNYIWETELPFDNKDHHWTFDPEDYQASLALRFRRPVVIDPAVICASLVDFFHQYTVIGREVTAPRQEDIGLYEILEPSYKRPQEEAFSLQKLWVGALQVPEVDTGWGYLCISNNVPKVEAPQLGACSFYSYAQPLTTIWLGYRTEWLYALDIKGKSEEEPYLWWAWGLYWATRNNWIGEEALLRDLVRRGYNLEPEFDPNWRQFEMEDECQTCGEIIRSFPYDLGEIKLGKRSRNWCHCRKRRVGYHYPPIERRFKVVGAWPISDEEAEAYIFEAVMAADSAS